MTEPITDIDLIGSYFSFLAHYYCRAPADTLQPATFALTASPRSR